MKSNRAAFLDRDGTLMIDQGYLVCEQRIEIMPGVIPALKLLQSAGLFLIVVTNQSGVGRGYSSLESVDQVNARLASLMMKEGVRLDAFYTCPHTPDASCDCRKPQVGLVLSAQADFQLELPHCLVVGDKESDIGLGRNIGAYTCRLGSATTRSQADVIAHNWVGLMPALKRWVIGHVDELGADESGRLRC